MAEATWDGAWYNPYAPPIFASPAPPPAPLPLPAFPQDRPWWMAPPVLPAAGATGQNQPSASHLLPSGHPWGSAPLIFPPAPADAAGQGAPAQPFFPTPKPPPLADSVNTLPATPEHRAPDPVRSDYQFNKLGDAYAPAGMTDIGPPLIGDGGQLFPGTAWGRKAADIGSQLAYRYIHGLLTLPQRAIEAAQQSAEHDFGPGPAAISDSDPPWQDPLIPVAVEIALATMGGAGAVPARANTRRAGLTGARQGAAEAGTATKATGTTAVDAAASAAGRGAASSGLPAPFDGELAARQLLGTTRTPAGRSIMFHAADRMVNAPKGRIPMSAEDVDQVLDGATRIAKRSYHPQGNTLMIENSNMPGRPRVVVDEATGQRVITVINPRQQAK